MKNWQNISPIDIEGEQWADIPSLKGRYQSSTKCRIRSLVYRYDFKRKNPKIISQFLSKNGYCRCVLRDTKENDFKVIYKFAHRLIAETFIDNPENLYTVNHKDLDKQNNEPYNLEWLSYAENNIHAWESGVFDKNVVKLTDEQVLYIYNSKEHWSVIANKYSVSYGTICSIRGNRHRNYTIPNGANKNNRVLSNDEALRIYKSTDTKEAIAKQFNIKIDDVWRIKSGRVFGKVTGQAVTHNSNNTPLTDKQILEINKSTLFVKDSLKKYKISFRRYKKIKSMNL